MSRSQMSHAQRIALKHNGNCRRVRGSIMNLHSILNDCKEVVSNSNRKILVDQLLVFEQRLRELVDRQFENDKAK